MDLELLRKLAGIQQEDWRHNGPQALIAEAKRNHEQNIEFIRKNAQAFERYVVDHGKSVNDLHELMQALVKAQTILRDLAQ